MKNPLIHWSMQEAEERDTTSEQTILNHTHIGVYKKKKSLMEANDNLRI